VFAMDKSLEYSGKINNISYIVTLFKVRFIHDTILFWVRLRQSLLYVLNHYKIRTTVKMLYSRNNGRQHYYIIMFR